MKGPPLKLISWNVNGIRAAATKGLLTWLADEQPFALAVQETKASPGQLSDELLSPAGYHSFWNAADRKGYSGVALFTREKPLDVSYGFGVKRFDTEGRVIVAEYEDFFLLNIYFPNGKKDDTRLAFKLAFYAQFLKFLSAVRKKKKTILVCGDVNTAHREIDLARPAANSTVSGFLPEERAWLDRFVAWGLTDTFRIFCPDPGHYTWWDLKSGARARNIGWRIDYFYIDRDSVPRIEDAFILKNVQGSDHCPIGVLLRR